MAEYIDAERVAVALLSGLRLAVRRVRQIQPDGELTSPERSALSLLDREGPATSSELAKIERMTPQSMGTTLSGLQSRGLIERNPDPTDGRRVVLSPTEAGRALLRTRRNAKNARLADALSQEFTQAELRQLMAVAPLIERLGRRI